MYVRIQVELLRDSQSGTINMPEGSRFFPGYAVRLPAIAGPRPDFFPPPCFQERAKNCADAGLSDWFGGACKIKFTCLKRESRSCSPCLII